jgi:hypothetical protein
MPGDAVLREISLTLPMGPEMEIAAWGATATFRLRAAEKAHGCGDSGRSDEPERLFQV